MISHRIEGHTAVITIDNPPANTWTPESLAALEKLVGEGWAKRMILTNERVDAATALRIGLVEEVADKGQGLAKAMALATRVATLSPRSVEYCKSLIHNGRNAVPRRAGLALERERFMDLFDHSDQLEGVNAFLEKRAPAWKND